MGYAQIIEASPAHFWEHQIEQRMDAGSNRQSRLSRFCKWAARLVAGERDRGLARAGGTELARGIAEMSIDGALGQSDPLCDHLRLEAVCGKAEHFQLTLRQSVERIVTHAAPSFVGHSGAKTAIQVNFQGDSVVLTAPRNNAR